MRISKTILAVDDEPNNLQILRHILRDSYRLLYATSGIKAIEAAEKHHPDLILLDIMMPEMAGYEVCELLKKRASTCHIPVIFVTSMGEVEDEAKGFDYGAVDYIQKPVSAAILLRRIETHLSLVRAHELEKSYKQAIFMLGEAGHYYDNDTGLHTWRMAAYARLLAKAAGWSGGQADTIELAASLHDTGKIGIPDSILKAPRKLTDEEWVIMKQHPEIGYSILNKSNGPIFTMAAEIARHHHERWDGSGYPCGLAGLEIPESARIAAVADVFDALSIKRPYKDAWSVKDSMAELRRIAGSHLEPRMVGLFEDIIPDILHTREIWEARAAARLEKLN